MAIGVTEPTVEVASTSNAASYALGAFNPTANAFLVLLVFAAGTVAAAPTVTVSPLTWTLRASQLYNSVDTAYVFTARVPASSGGSAAITFDCTGDNATGAVVMCLQFTNVNPIDPIRQLATAAASSTDPTVTLGKAILAANASVAAFGINRAAPAATEPTNWTEFVDTGVSTPVQGAAAAYRADSGTLTTVAFTAATGAWGMIVLELNEATQGAQALDAYGAAGLFGG